MIDIAFSVATCTVEFLPIRHGDGLGICVVYTIQGLYCILVTGSCV